MNTGPRRAADPTFHESWEHIAGNQACLAHILRDYQDCAETYPDAIWPVQAQRALRGLIHAWHEARDQQLSLIPADIAGPLEKEFRHAVLAGLASVPRVPGPKNSTKQKPGRELLEFCRDRRSDVLLFAEDTSIWPTNDLASHCISWGCCAVSGLAWWSRCLGARIVACASDISGAAGGPVGVAAA
jgi:hypothetical protein